MSRSHTLVSVALGACLLLGLAITAFGVYFIALGMEARGWPTVEGQVVATSIRIDTSSSDDAVTREQRERLRKYYPSITYTWAVDGQSYTGSRYRLGTTHEKYDTRAEAVQAAAKLRSGTAVRVYHDPDDPSQAVLDPAISGGVFVPLPLGLLFLAAGVLGLRHRQAIGTAAAAGAAGSGSG